MTGLLKGEIAEDRLLDGAVRLLQPRQGYRVAIDPVLLAAAAPLTTGRVLDLGCGVGAVLLCYARRAEAAQLTGLERDDMLADIARQNLAINGLEGRGRIVTGDLARLPEGLEDGGFDLVLTNPPYLEPGRADPSPVIRKRHADVESPDFGLADWLGRAIGLCRHKGWLGLVQRADRLDHVLAALAGRMGAITLIALHVREGEEARRILVFARKGVRTATRIAAPLFLHGADGAFTPETDSILRGKAAFLRLEA